MKLSENFDSSEFSEDPTKYAHPDLIKKLQAQRDFNGAAIYPSEATGATARMYAADMTESEYKSIYMKNPSRHCVLIDRKSTAQDWFSALDPYQTLCQILRSGLWYGVGIYFDTRDNHGKNAVMFHTDFGRARRLLWLRENGKRFYETAGKSFYDRLARNLCEWQGV
jgi:hypothetical protein